MDQTQDIGGRVLYRIQQLYQPPEYVKKASVDDLCGHIDNDGNRDVPLQAYGDPQRMLFPCHTAAATWVSMGFFAEKKANFKQFDAQSIEDRILIVPKFTAFVSKSRNFGTRSPLVRPSPRWSTVMTTMP